MAAATARGIALFGLTVNDYYEGAGRPGLVVGYTATPEHAFAPAIAALIAALNTAGMGERCR